MVTAHPQLRGEMVMSVTSTSSAGVMVTRKPLGLVSGPQGRPGAAEGEDRWVGIADVGVGGRLATAAVAVRGGGDHRVRAEGAGGGVGGGGGGRPTGLHRPQVEPLRLPARHYSITRTRRVTTWPA